MKCLEKEPRRRYSSAAALGDDLRRYLGGEPIVARPATPWDRLFKWEGKPAIAGLAASLVLAVVVGFAAVTSQWLRAEALRKEEARQRGIADELRITADDRRRDAEEQRAEAEKGRAEAQANFGLARAAVDDFHVRVSESRLLQVPGLQTLRRELLGYPRKFYEDFLRRKQHDRSLRFGLAAAQLRVARISAEIDGQAAAQSAYRTAMASYESLYRERPDDTVVQAGLADSLRGLALANPDEPAPLDLMTRSQAMCAELAAARPGDEGLQLELAPRGNRSRRSASCADRPGEAIFWYEPARDIEERLVRSHPDDPERLSILGETLGRLAGILDPALSPAEASALQA